MTINRPYRRTYRQSLPTVNSSYISHPKFAQDPVHYIRAFTILQKDLQELFDYVEPAESNKKTYSYRTHALLLRACIEIEANCKAILKENGYVKQKKGKDVDMNMDDYKKINISHRLSSYQIKIPYWNGVSNLRTPFSAWSTGSSPDWYKAYNATKHDRHVEFHKANFENVIDACCGLLVILSAQFCREDFSPNEGSLLLDGINDGMDTGIGDYFRVKFPNDWPFELRYGFNWNDIKDEAEPFQNFNYLTV